MKQVGKTLYLYLEDFHKPIITRLTEEDIEKIIKASGLTDFITDCGDGWYRVQDGSGWDIYVTKGGVEILEKALHEQLLKGVAQ